MNILCGYNVNIDSVYRISGAEISELLSAFERTEILEKIENPPGKILSESDFAAGLAYCMKNGCGAEWLVFEQAVFEFLKNRYFDKSLVRMGGNAGIMANALSELGASRVVPNVAVPSKTQLSLFSEKAVYFPDVPLQTEEKSDSGSGNNTSSPSSSSSPSSFSNQDPIHFVFDFSEGETFSLYGTEIRAPRENRFIATCDHLNFRLFTSPAFESYALKHAGEMDGALISGFHLLLETYPDGSTYKEVLDNSFSRLKAWKAKNEKLRVHVEFGHFASGEVANAVFLKFAGTSDSIGMNEDELAMLHNLHGIPAEGILRMEAEAVGMAACKLASLHGLGKLFIHTREFVLAAFKPDSGSSGGSEISDEGEISGKWGDRKSPALLKAAEKNLEAMGFGLRCAGAYAASGRLEGRKFVEKEASKLQESPFGRQQVRLFLEAFGGETCGQGAFALMEGYIICILPTLLCKSPLTTVGLGDTLTAGTFLRGLELDVQA
ncbi:ADP-dependent glucokinase [Methanosarcina sp. 2.H.T.1A.6]|uniref:ADP-dependent glucokinase/phosphofructokinase n=1 Tax=unclassified Methanosarcina TaxID=2644672 RepID=UPI00062199C5|nr:MULTISPECIES: ADP-dependent glucokinase/phosphofructokinase [unclassified Methanosarcina]KKG11754.1 ADP-dependent glucokinase [Methanosarcina sp. 2.H.T.1A.15]KKG17648.1 ADP-dependent glucokinase [Methanosarcina sp. 2.H.T.1A.3]KKG21888.1 ADP-dependent glucokinase [Methanosarcina sp. 2.H.T.1A.6]KKG25424.1 ADP-dependent glucokinase [Methanosarcina sp. 2.H.T.1A.8]